MVNPNKYSGNKDVEAVRQEDLLTIVDLARSIVRNDLANRYDPQSETNDGFGYLRTSDTSICVFNSTDLYSPELKQLLGIGDIEIDVTHWLDPSQLGKGPNELTSFKFYGEKDSIRGIRIFNIRESVNSSLWGGNKSDRLPGYLQDDNEIIADMKQSFEGLPEKRQYSDQSLEQLTEIGRRMLEGIDPIALEMGLLDINQQQAEELISLLISAKPTEDPYFEEVRS